MVKAIIFDFDGVLVDSEHINIEAARRAFQAAGYALSPEDEGTIVGRNPRDYVPAIIARHGLALSPAPIRNAEHLAYAQIWPSMVSMRPSARNTVLELKKKNVAIALATTNSQTTIDRFLEKFELAGVFSAFITAENVSRLKPDPEIYLKAIAALKIPKEEIIAVEDTSIGLMAAKNAGLRCAVIPTNYTEQQDFRSADFVMQSADELLSLL